MALRVTAVSDHRARHDSEPCRTHGASPDQALLSLPCPDGSPELDIEGRGSVEAQPGLPGSLSELPEPLAAPPAKGLPRRRETVKGTSLALDTRQAS